jgi:hypothetical protein
MNLNLLLNIDDFRWQLITVSRSQCIDNFSLLLPVIIENEDALWLHDEMYNLCYGWGCVHNFYFDFDFAHSRTITGGWMSYNNHKTILNLWKRSQNRSCSGIDHLHANHNQKPRAVIGCQNQANIITSESDRHNAVVDFYKNNTACIIWDDDKHPFLPNIDFSNRYLAEKAGILSTDLDTRKRQITELSKYYCDKGYIEGAKGGAKEANADTVGSEVAFRNFYTEEKDLSSEEQRLRKSMRKIFSLVKNGEKMYLSIDFEKGNAFEWCNAGGEHQGEYRFDGIPNDKDAGRDTSGKHDIWTLRK